MSVVLAMSRSAYPNDNSTTRHTTLNAVHGESHDATAAACVGGVLAAVTYGWRFDGGHAWASIFGFGFV